MDKQGLDFQLYKLDNENEVSVLIKEDTIWVTQKTMSTLFDVGQPAIAKHLKNIFESGELVENQVYSKMEYTANDGKILKSGNRQKLS